MKYTDCECGHDAHAEEDCIAWNCPCQVSRPVELPPFILEDAVMALSDEDAEWAARLESNLFYRFVGRPELGRVSNV